MEKIIPKIKVLLSRRMLISLVSDLALLFQLAFIPRTVQTKFLKASWDWLCLPARFCINELNKTLNVFTSYSQENYDNLQICFQQSISGIFRSEGEAEAVNGKLVKGIRETLR